MGLEIADGGRVMCNDIPLDNGADLGGICSYVSQEPFLFQGTLAENIALGLAPEQINRERVMDSLRRAAFSSGKPDSEWITLLVDDRGNNLSEGQKQRIALARALYFDRPLLILDEPTSALDSETELQVISTLRELKNSGKTILIIAHRDRVMDLCDHIYEIRNHKLEIIR
jgi:ABC-type multidrug transport system fused ATPase/permease subunit